MFDLLNIGRHTNFHGYFGVLVYSTICTTFILRKNIQILLKIIQQNFSCLANTFCELFSYIALHFLLS